MSDGFFGDATPLRDRDYAAAADELGCTVAAVRAVAEVESAGGGFLGDGRPKILFERHVFHARTGGRFAAAQPSISQPVRGGYLGGPREYDRLALALALDRRAALESASWGKFQVMGLNCAACGHRDVESFVAAMVSGEPAHLSAFVAFIKANGLAGHLVRRDWAGFARRYNGSGYAANHYDRRMADAYARHVMREDRPPLRQGDRGPAVTRLQGLLGVVADGIFGSATANAVVVRQRQSGLSADGAVGSETWRTLLGLPRRDA